MTKQAKKKAAKKAPSPESLLRRENQKLRAKVMTSGAHTELIAGMVAEAYSSPPRFRLPKLPRKSQRKGLDTEVAVAHLSDTQIGKTTPTYDSEIAYYRIMEYAEKVGKVVEARRSNAKIEELRLYLGGDMIEGEVIFAHQPFEIDQSVFEQAVKTTPEAIVSAIFYWLGMGLKIKVVCCAGNHGRPVPRHTPAHPKTNWDRVVYAVSELMCERELAQAGYDSKLVTWVIPDDFYAIDNVLGHKNLLVHGHQIRGGFAGFPWYGVGRRLTGWIDAIEEDWDHLYFGHFHTYTQGYYNSRFWFCNGTTESDNAYAREELAASGQPMQRLQFFHRKHGMIADCPISLTYGI